MNFKPTLALGILLSVTTLNANAAGLNPYAINGVNLVYSSVSNVTWTKDANLFKTLYDANPNLVNLITGLTPNYNDPFWGNQVISDGGTIDDFDTATGRVTWWGGIAFTNYLNSINYGGSNQWRLPTSNVIVGYNDTGNELGQLFYSELGGTAGNNIPDTASFINEKAYAYWSGTEYASYPNYAWVFNTVIGFQGYYDKNHQYYAWAVSPGQVTAAVAEPGVIWLLGAALLGWGGLKRRGHAG